MDRISNLGDDIIHHIYSFVDMKYAVQSCTLSKRWEHIWTSMPHLNFNSRLYPDFGKFVKHALAGRNNHTDVSAVQVAFTGEEATHFAIKSIVNYAYSHNVRKLNITLTTRVIRELPREFFSCQTLKHLSIVSNQLHACKCHMQNLAWDFPVLETLNLEKVEVSNGVDKSVDLFSKCVKLKQVRLHDCSTFTLGVLNICAPQLSSLTITGFNNFPKAFNVVCSSRLENLDLVINRDTCLNFAGKPPEGLKKVNLAAAGYKYVKINTRALLDLFLKLHSAKHLILDWEIIQILSLDVDQVSHEACPFEKLRCLEIDTRDVSQKHLITEMPIQVKNYFLKNSPNATFIMELPLEAHLKLLLSQKRSLESEATAAKKLAKMQHEVIAKQKAQIKMKDEVIAQQKAQIQMRDEVFAKQKAQIQMRDEVYAKQKAQIQMRDEVIAQQKAQVQMLLNKPCS